MSEKARDYMLRRGNTINLAYQTPLVGGLATDTFLVTRNNMRFRRARSVNRDRPTILRVRLYKMNGTKPVNSMNFVFGQIGGRSGWVAAAAIKRAAVQKPGTNICAGKVDGIYCDPIIASAYVCRGGAPGELLQCPPRQQCVGPNPGETIACQ